MLLVFGLPWLLTAVTGLLHSLLTSAGYARTDLRILMQLHQMSLLGSLGKRWYPLVVGAALLLQAALGSVLLKRRVSGGLGVFGGKGRVRVIHVATSALAGALIVVVALSGFAMRLQASHLGNRAAAGWWLALHHGGALGLGSVWPLAAGLALITVSATGVWLSPVRRLVVA